MAPYSDPLQPSTTLPAGLCVDGDEARRLQLWERGPVRERPAKRFHELFEEIASREPERAAVIAEHGIQSYGELERSANRIASLLLEHSVAHGESVAVLTDCSPQLPAAVLGIWKAGAVYVPLAIEQPAARLAHMAGDSGAKVLLILGVHAVASSLAESVATILRPEDRVLSPGDAQRPVIAGTPQDLAYVIYTSGTTGMPKGVMIQHDGLVNAAYMSGEEFGLTPDDRVALVATPGFDASLWEMGMALLHGIALVPVPRIVRDDPWNLRRWYERHGVSVAFHAPSYLRVGERASFPGLRILITGGEAANHDDARAYAGQLALWHAYGPTESSIFTCAERLSPDPDVHCPLTVGRPFANTCISIRGTDGNRVQPGSTGEVWLGGIGLGRGYLNNPELTAQRYVKTPEGRFYRTGDLGRWTEDGRLELAGRIDDQVKLHGQRLELGEVERALLSHPSVAEAVVLLDTSAEETKVLRAFVSLRLAATPPTEMEWRYFLGNILPAYMLPASVISITEVPLTHSGKIDRQALLSGVRNRSDAVRSEPQGEVEIRIAAVWNDLLGTTVSREDNFFSLGGNSLLGATVAHRLSGELERPVSIRDLFAAPTLAGFARRVEALISVAAPVVTGSDLASEGQVEFKVAEMAGLDTRTFTIPLLRIVQGERPSLQCWNRAWATLVARHEALHTRFYEDPEGRLRRAIEPLPAGELETTRQADRAAAWAYVRFRQAEPFDMSALPLWRAGLIDVANTGEQLFWLALHHAVGDGQSLGILVRELAILLRGEELARPTGSFGESVRRAEEYLGGPDCAVDACYWRDLLLGQPDESFAEGPLDFPRSIAAESGNHRFEARLDAAVTRELHAIARQHEASLHALMLTLLAMEARRRTRREHVIIGAAASTRETAAEAHVVGYYVNMLPIACHLRRNVTVGGALREMQQALAAGLQHARYPFARMYRDFWERRPQQRHPARYPLFDLAITENPGIHVSPASLTLAPVPGPDYERTDASPGQDMVLTHEVLPNGDLLLQWHVNAALYARETAKSWFDSIRGWAEWLADDPTRTQEIPPALLPREVVLLEGWEQGAKIERPPLRFHELFERALDDGTSGWADRPAIITAAGTTTYGALEKQANAIAHGLHLRGLETGDVVAVLTERSASLPAAILGIWKAGGIYMPLAADLPSERLVYMAKDAGAAFLIALDGLVVPPLLAREMSPPFRPEEVSVTFLSAHGHRPPPRTGTSDAYIIYTSGSTGRPKGTLVGHDAYVNSVLGCGEAYGLTEDDRCLMFASPSFDVSLSDIGVPLAFGAALCPVPSDVVASPIRFRAFLSEYGVTLADITPTYLRLFKGAPLPSLRILVTGGEPAFAGDVETYAGRLSYFNAYGPTENAITSTLGKLRSGSDSTPAAGCPLPNTSVHVCDSEGNPVPPGVAGELWLGGVGLARGYVGRPDLTAAAFRETPHGRRYRSGDLGRWRASGEIEILGRIDDQVKLNGIRVELGEIEHVLSQHPDVIQAVVLLDFTTPPAMLGTPVHGEARENHSLWAFVRLVEGRPSPAEDAWREYLAGRLPRCMIPSAVIAVDDIPLMSSGKVDKSALKQLLAGRIARGEGQGQEPEPGLETDIARLWSDLLGQDAIHRDDNFFSLGGHSLLAIAVAHRLEQMLGKPVPARELFAEPTLRGLAERVRRLRDEDPGDQTSSDRATEGQREFWIAEQAGMDTRSFVVPLTLVSGKTSSLGEWRRAWQTLVARHDALRTSFHQEEHGTLRRSVHSDLVSDLDVTTVSDMAGALTYIQERQTDPIAMGCAPLWRAGLAQVRASQQHVFWLALHHSIVDGVSLGVLTEELSILLDGGTLPEATGHFDRSAGREERYLASSESQADALYWRTMLDGLGNSSDGPAQPFEEWQLDFPRTIERTADNAKGSHVFRIRLEPATASGLREFAQKHGATLHSLMLTIMALEVRRRTGRREFLLSTAASTRDLAHEARTVGYYVNLLPVPCRAERSESVEQTLRTMQRNLAEGLQHARYPFARMYSEFRARSGATPHPARYPLCDMAVTENPGGAVTSFGAILRDDGYERRMNAPAQDMVLVHEGQADGSLALNWYVNAGIYEKETAEAWIQSIVGWTHLLAGNERVPDSPLPELLPAEKDLLATWEHGPALPQLASSFPARFEYLAKCQPERPALITEEGIHTYAEVDARSNALARALLDLGVLRHEVVGVLTGRSTSLPETVLAIWKAGACYVPLVEDLPGERLAFIARDAAIRTLAVLDGLDVPPSLAAMNYRVLRPESLTDEYILSHDQHVAIKGVGIAASDAAYIIYTSGSTGEPKGVKLLHGGLNNLGVGIVPALDMRSDDRAAMMASPAFDAWIAELVMAWAVGAAVVPVLRCEMDDIAGMRRKFARLGVTVVTMLPSYLRLFGQADLPGLRLLLTAGEAPHRADAMHYGSRLRYMNGYGPTENTVAVSFGQITPHSQRLAVGKPLANTSVHIRGRDGETVPPGAAGVVWLGGAQLAEGYLNRLDLTDASFVQTPAGRLYCTGDLGRWTSHGELEILGRSDGQVKLRGQRVELGEIEHRLRTYPGVRQAVAALETASTDEPVLWAFVCLDAAAGEPSQSTWRTYLSESLSSYMLPSAVIRVPAIPTTTAGKVDRTALLHSASEWRVAQPDGADFRNVPPLDGMERRIARVWQEHLGHRTIGREDDFFALGGNSLRAIAVVNQLRRTLECTVNDLYEHPRLADFAAICRQRPEHLRALLQSARRDWESYRNGLASYESERDASLAIAWREYETRNQFYSQIACGKRREYGHVLLTGATGYLGSYLLRELLADNNRCVSVLVRGDDDDAARLRLRKALCYYFGPQAGTALCDDSRLAVLAGDLRRENLGLSSHVYSRLGDSLQAVFHCAANVKHFGHGWEFHADNVAATERLLRLAARAAASPADFHLVSTLSVCGKAPEAGFQLFTEYDRVPEALDENYYIRSKQEAERLVIASREYLANACIHRVGNLVFAADGGPLQHKIEENAFFRLLAAFIQLGVAPDDSHLWLCHVDLVARGLVLLACTHELNNEIHHLEHSRRDTLAGFVTAIEGVRACGFDEFLERLRAAVNEPAMDAAMMEILESFNLYRGQAPQARARRLEIASQRTNSLLGVLGLAWPTAPVGGQMQMLHQAARLFSPQITPGTKTHPSSTVEECSVASAVDSPDRLGKLRSGVLAGISSWDEPQDKESQNMNPPTSLAAVVAPVISMVPAEQLRDTLSRAFTEEQAAVGTINEFFQVLPSAPWSAELLHTVAASWKATHLKMLAIYGLSCRLQRMAETASNVGRSKLYLAAARNASTSYEDLGLDFDGHTHAELYDDFAGALTGGDLWQLPRYRLPEAHHFSRWIYRNMVVEDIPVGLLTNMFSEIYNHGEYSIALPAAARYFERHTQLSAAERGKATAYISAHVEDDVEAAHFLVVVEALDRYLEAAKRRFDAKQADSVFRTYLRNLGQVMAKLTELMKLDAAKGAAA